MESADKIINSPYDERGFAMLHNSSAIRKTEYEGMVATTAVAYLKALIEQEEVDFQSGIDPKHKDRTLLALEDLQIFHEFFMSCVTEHGVEIDYDKLRELTHERAGLKGGYCYWPSGWCSNDGEAHFAAIKLHVSVIAKHTYNVFVINQGDGMNFHSVAASGNDIKKSGKNKRCYASPRAEIDLSSNAGEFFVLGIISLKYDRRIFDAAFSIPYDKEDLYGLLQCCGFTNLEQKITANQFVSPQRGGTCPITNSKAVIRDILLMHQCKESIIKRFVFSIKFTSLVFADKDSSCNPKVFASSIRETYVRIAKHYPETITAEEQDSCLKRIEGIEKRFQDDQSMLLIHYPELPKLTGEIELTSLPKAMRLPKRNNNHLFREFKGAILEQKKEEADITEDNVLKYVRGLKKCEGAQRIKEALRCLPSTSGEEEDAFWDKLPQDDLLPLLDEFCPLLKNATCKADKLTPCDKFEISLILYDIAAQLAPKIKDLNLNSYTLGVSDVFSDFEYSDAKQFYNIKQIFLNFQRRRENNKRVILSNHVGENNSCSKDSTYGYIVGILVDHNSRIEMLKALKELKFVNHNKKGLGDSDLVKLLLTKITSSETGLSFPKEKYVNKAFLQLLNLSATTHNSGTYNTGYTCQNSKLGSSVPADIFFNKDTRYFSDKKIFGKVNDYRHNRTALNGEAFYSNWPKRELLKTPRDKSILIGSAQNTCYLPSQASPQKTYLSRNILDIIKPPKPPKPPINLYKTGTFNPRDKQGRKARGPIALDEQLREIEAAGIMKVQQLLEWSTQNIRLFQHKMVQIRFRQMLFCFLGLDYTLANFRNDTIQLLNRFFKKAFRFCQNEYHKSEQLGLDLRAMIDMLCQTQHEVNQYLLHAAKLYNLNIQKCKPINYTDLLWQLIINREEGYELHLELLIDYYGQHGLEHSVDFARLLSAKIISQTSKHKLSLKSKRTWSSYYNQLIDYISYHYLAKKKSTEKENQKSINQVLAIVLVSALRIKNGITNWNFDKKQSILTVTTPNHNIQIRLTDGYTWIDGQEPSPQYSKLVSKTLSKIGIKTKPQVTAKRLDNNEQLLTTLQNRVELLISQNNLSATYVNVTIDNLDYRLSPLANKSIILNLPIPQKDLQQYFTLSDPRAKNSPVILWPMSHQGRAFISNQNSWQIANVQKECFSLKTTEEFILDLTQAYDSDLTKAWSDYLKRFTALKDVSVTVNCTKGLPTKTGRTLVEFNRIELHKLGLSFQAVDSHLECQQYPGYFLTENHDTDIPFTWIILLKNEQRQKKYLLPAYKLKNDQNKNSVFSKEECINKKTVLKRSVKVFECHKNTYNQLVSHDPDANLYLAVLTRSIGDYEQAVHYLAMSENPYKNSAYQVEIANMILDWHDLSPLGAAFDCKLAAHMAKQKNKWLSGYDNWLSASNPQQNKFLKHLWSQLKHYHLCFSTRKQGVNIMSEACQLQTADYELLHALREGNDKEKPLEPRLFPASEYMKFSNVFDSNRTKPYEKIFEHTTLSKGQDRQLAVRFELLGSVKNYLAENFLEFYQAMVEGNLKERQQITAILFFLSRSPSREIVQDLILVLSLSQNPAIHNGDKEKFTTAYECFLALRQRIRKKYTHWRIAAPLTAKEVKITKTSHPAPKFDIASLKFDLNDKKKEDEATTHPLSAIVTKYFEVSEHPIANEKNLFKEEPPGSLDEVALELIDGLLTGHRKNTETTRSNYKFKREHTFESFKEKLNKNLIKCKQEAKGSLEKLLNKAKHLKHDDQDKIDAQRVLQASGIRPKVTTKLIIETILTRTPQKLQEANPFLSQQNFDDILKLFCKYAFQKTKADQLTEACNMIAGIDEIDDLSCFHQRQLGLVLDKKRCYDYQQYPEFLIYEFLSTRMIRGQQSDVLIKLIKLIESHKQDPEQYRHALLQFAAGGGKTSVLIPILAFLFARMGLLPIIFNTPELFKIGLNEIPRALRNLLEQQVEVIDFGLDHIWEVDELKKLLNDLKKWCGSKCVLMRPETWHSLNITCRMARMSDELEQEAIADAAFEVLEYFKTYGIKLEDEGHQISNPMQQCIKTYGPNIQIPLEQQDFMVHLYDCLLGFIPEFANLANLAGIKDKSKKKLSDKEFATLQNHMVDIICEMPVFDNIKKSAKRRLYLTQKNNTRPLWLQLMDKKLANLIVLGREFVQTLLKYILTLKFGTDYGLSTHRGDLTAAPKKDGKAVSTHFGDPRLVLALSIQLYAITGVPHTLLEKLLKEFITRHEKERKYNSNTTHAEKALNELLFNDLAKGSTDYIHLDALSEKDIKVLSQKDNIRFNPKVIKHFLSAYVFPKILIPKYRIESTAADFQAGFYNSIIFTATPGMLEVYPAYLSKEHYYEALDFEAEVVHTMLQPKNSRSCILTMTNDPKRLFTEIKKKYPEILKSIHSLFDRGAFVSDLDPKAVLHDILSVLKEDDEEDCRGNGLCLDGGELYFQSKHEALNESTFKDLDIAKAVKRYGFTPEQLLLFLFLDLSKTTGTDLKRPYDDVAANTIGKGQDLTGTIQTLMRDRQFLDADAQTAVWLIFKSLYQYINPEDTKHFNLTRVVYWLIGNDAKNIKTKIIQRAYQGIYQIVSSIAWLKVHKKERKFSDYKDILQQKMAIEPYRCYALESHTHTSEKVLTDYKKKLLRDLKLSEKKDLSQQQQLLIVTIIKQTARLILEMKQPHGAEFGGKVFQEQQQQQQQELEEEHKFNKLKNTGATYKLAFEEYNLRKHSLQPLGDQILAQNTKLLSQLEIWPFTHKNCNKMKLPQLWFCHPHFRPFEIHAGVVMQSNKHIQFMKPIQAFLVCCKNNEYAVMALTAMGLQLYATQILEHNPDTDSNHYTIFGMNGDVLATTKPLDFHFTEIPELNDAILFGMLLNGNVYNQEALIQLAQNYGWSRQDYRNLIQTIGEIQVCHRTINTKSLLALQKLLESPITLKPHSKTPNQNNQSGVKTTTLRLFFERPTRTSAAILRLKPASPISRCLIGRKPKNFSDKVRITKGN